MELARWFHADRGPGRVFAYVNVCKAVGSSPACCVDGSDRYISLIGVTIYLGTLNHGSPLKPLGAVCPQVVETGPFWKRIRTSMAWVRRSGSEFDEGGLESEKWVWDPRTGKIRKVFRHFRGLAESADIGNMIDWQRVQDDLGAG
jgi:hypothetical protein